MEYMMISEQEIQKVVQDIGAQINSTHGDKVFIGVLNGSFMFFSDLIKHIEGDIQVDFIRVKSYTNQQRGEVKLLKDIELDVTDKDVYIVEDIIDSGNTINFIKDHFSKKKIKSLKIICLLEREFVSLGDYVGFKIKNEWIYGYGLDHEHGYKRNSTQIYCYENIS